MEDPKTEDKITAEQKTTAFAARLKEKLAGEPGALVTELVDSQLDAVSGGTHGSAHVSIDL
jgi:hypothetical protein